jgi:uncharacterized protein (TIGR03790 family)
MVKALVAIAMLAVGAGALPAAGPGDEVIVVYNSSLPESKAVAEYYAQRRQVPANQVFGFALTSEETMSRAEFRKGLQLPLAEALENKKLWHIAPTVIRSTNDHPERVEWRVVRSKIRYAALCFGVPLRIAPDPDLVEEGTETMRPEMRRNGAAVDSELTLLPLVEQKLMLAGPLRNPAYTTTNTALLHPTNGILMVARLDGPTADIARGLVEKALQAEADGLWGRAYFDLRNTTDPAYKSGDEMIRNASEICRHLGFETIVDENPGTFPASFPMSQIALYVGWYDGDVSGPFTRPKVEFMPGAFAYHLHSFSAASLRTTNRFWVGPLLAKGATATMGCVDEPYLAGTPDMAVFCARFVYAGFSFGEAACAAQPVLSWQTTAVGDPLYRPFGKNADLLAAQLQQRKSKLLDWCLLRLLNLNLAANKPAGEGLAFLENLGETRKSAVLTEKLGNLYAAQGKPESAIYAWNNALALDPSPLQRLRLLLTLGEHLTALGRNAEAYADYQQVLADWPDYPDKPALYGTLLPLAQKLNKKADAEKYEAELKPKT